MPPPVRPLTLGAAVPRAAARGAAVQLDVLLLAVGAALALRLVVVPMRRLAVGAAVQGC